MDQSHDDGEARFDAIVLGAGISGLVSASVLGQQGLRVLLIDEYDHIGGNHIAFSINGYTFDVGSLIFQDDSPLLEHFPELLSRYVAIDPSWGKLSPQGSVTKYPISVRDDILAAGPVVWLRIAVSLVTARLYFRKMCNARDFARFWMGAYLMHRTGLDTYMRRFYGTRAEDIDLELARKRMLWIPEHASVLNTLRKLIRPRRNNSGPTNTQMVRPAEGFQPLYQLAADRLASYGVKIVKGVKLQTLSKLGDHYRLTTDRGNFVAKRTISTIPVNRAVALCGMPHGQVLPTIDLITLYFSFSGERGFHHQIMYNFSHSGAWKRLTVYSDFYGKAHDREYFAVEVIGGEINNNIALAEQDFRRHVSANGLFRGDLRLESSQLLTQAYPIYRHGAAGKSEQAIAALRDFGVESFGRQGGFNYQSTARVSTLEAEAALAKGHIDLAHAPLPQGAHTPHH